MSEERFILKKLQHEYSEVEAVQVFARKIKELETTIGMLKSEIAELEYKLGTEVCATVQAKRDLKRIIDKKGGIKEVIALIKQSDRNKIDITNVRENNKRLARENNALEGAVYSLNRKLEIYKRQTVNN